MIGKLLNWQKQIGRVFAATLIILMLLIFPAPKAAHADDQGLLTAAQTFIQTVTEARSVFDDFSQEAESFFDDGSGTVRKALKGLPAQLKRLSAETDVATREQIRGEVAAQQDSITTFVKSFDDWIAKANTAEKQYGTTVDAARTEFKKSFDQSQKALKTETNQKVDNLKLTLKQTAKAVSALNDSASRVLNGKVPFVPGSFDEQLTTLDKTFDTVSDLVASFAK